MRVAVWPAWSTCLIASCASRRPQTVSIASVVAHERVAVHEERLVDVEEDEHQLLLASGPLTTIWPGASVYPSRSLSRLIGSFRNSFCVARRS